MKTLISIKNMQIFMGCSASSVETEHFSSKKRSRDWGLKISNLSPSSMHLM
jgi:hypothetical protein